MADSLTRRQFTTAAAAIAATGALARNAPGAAANPKPVRVGFVGVGGRGAGMLRYSLGIKGVQVPAVCDVNAARAGNAAKMVARAGQKPP
ncbi:MAG: gfo/Idh/MocA family oxidoreductase, partial [Phycisphaerae bacterium]|nr:gfo/Idh/MocA family oxidoreductase [Phycisphaerae bacterium]